MPINIQSQNRGRQSQNVIFNNSSVSSGSFMLNSSQQDYKDNTNQVSDQIFVLEREVSDLHVKYKFLLDQCEQKPNLVSQNVNDPENDHHLQQIRMEVSLIADSLLSKESLLNDLKSQQNSHVQQNNDKLRNSFQNDQDFQNNGNRRFQRNNQQQMYNVLNQKSSNPNYQNSLILIDGKEQKQNFDSEMFGSQLQMSEISQINAYHNLSQNQSGNTINNLSSSLRNYN